MTGECKIHNCYVTAYYYDDFFLTVPVNLTDTNIGLLIIGILFLIGILTLIVWLTLFQKCDTASNL